MRSHSAPGLALILFLLTFQVHAVNFERIFVTCNNSNTVNIYNTATGAVASVPVGVAPVGIAYNQAEHRIYVANSGSASISRIHPESLAVTTLNMPGALPEGLAVMPDGEHLLVTSQERRSSGGGSNGVVYVVALASFSVVAEILVQDDPEGVVISQDGRQAWVACDLRVEEIDFTAGITAGVVSTVINGVEGTDDFEHLAVTADKSRLYATNASRNRLEVIDLGTEIILTSINTGTDPEFVLLEAAAGRLHVSNQQGNSVSVANSANHTLLGTVSLGGLVEPRGLALGIGPLVWGTAAGNNALYRFDPATRQLIGSPIALTGAGPEELAVVLYDTNAADHWKMFE